MSVTLTSRKNGIEVDLANGTWAGITACAQQFEGEVYVSQWNGCHDSQEYSPEELMSMAKRVRECAAFAEALEELAENGGAILS